MKNWRTTLVGLLMAILNSAAPLLSGTSPDWKTLGMSAGMAALGYLAKDSNVTGGTVQQ